jgi:hypothetical protein
MEPQIAGSEEMAGLAGDASKTGNFGGAGDLRLNPADPAKSARQVWPQTLGQCRVPYQNCRGRAEKLGEANF